MGFELLWIVLIGALLTWCFVGRTAKPAVTWRNALYTIVALGFLTWYFDAWMIAESVLLDRTRAAYTDQDGDQQNFFFGAGSPVASWIARPSDARVITASYFYESAKMSEGGQTDLITKMSAEEIRSFYRTSLESAGFAVVDALDEEAIAAGWILKLEARHPVTDRIALAIVRGNMEDESGTFLRLVYYESGRKMKEFWARPGKRP